MFRDVRGKLGYRCWRCCWRERVAVTLTDSGEQHGFKNNTGMNRLDTNRKLIFARQAGVAEWSAINCPRRAGAHGEAAGSEISTTRRGDGRDVATQPLENKSRPK